MTTLLQQWQPLDLTSEAVTFPATMYTSPDVYKLEQECIFGKAWYYVGNTSQLQDPGSYFTIDIAEQPLIILRNRAGDLRAFFNICSHRAAPLALGSGQCNHLTCLYHAWTFDLEGNLRGAPEMDDAEGFDPACHSLRAVKVDTWESFIFVNLDLNAKPLATQLGDLPEKFKRYRLKDWVLVHSINYEMAANWKLLTENSAESYHEPSVHALVPKFYKGLRTEAKQFYYWQYSPMIAEMDAAARAVLKPEGLSLEGLSEDESNGVSITSLFPNFGMSVGPSFAVSYLIDPQGPAKTRVQQQWLVPNQSAALSAERLEAMIGFFDTVMKEDLDLLPHVQKRMQSSGFRPGRLSPSREMGTHLFQQLVMQHLTSGSSRTISTPY
ncbi:MAG: aromatic ring-hydroxylating dioxygenase subunit alpha [Leptolyngbyaceae cyanobacterium bins.302]|nr:aromatic ring-hydroxylating dioxygenase subunit alpha [Leptolyngbyaceae cyanobacterium bins.302]